MRYKNRKDWIIKFVKNKKVLDLGCVQHNVDKTMKPSWIHGIIHKHAKAVLGVDCLEKEVSILKEQGYNVVCANVETMELGDKFEIIIAGDIIEHLSNCGKFMERVGEHLDQGGLFLVTTPNPVQFLRFVQLLIRGRVTANREHTCWFTQQVLSQLAGRYDFKIVDVAYVDDSYQYYNFKLWWSPFLLPILLLNYIICFVLPQFCETLCFVLKKRATDKV